MDRILIVGCPGSGKSTFAKELHRITGIPLIHLDMLFWNKDGTTVEKSVFYERLTEALEEERWIIDGNYSRTIPMRLPKCDTIIYLDFNRWECLLGMFQRVTRWYGKQRPDMGGECRERFDPEFVRWIWNFNEQNRVRNYTWLAQAKHAKSIVLRNRREVKAFLAGI